MYLFNVKYKLTATEKKKTFTKLIKFDDAQSDMLIALTKKGYLDHLQFTAVQFCFVSTLGRRRTN